MSRGSDAKEGPFIPGTPGAAAGFESGDVVIAMTDPDDPGAASRNCPMIPISPARGCARLFRIRAPPEAVGGPGDCRARRSAAEKKEIDLKVAPTHRIDFGVHMQMGPILVVCDGSPAAKLVQAPDAEKKLEGDLIEAVSVTDVDGKELVFKEKRSSTRSVCRPNCGNGRTALTRRSLPAKPPGDDPVLRRHVEAAGRQFKSVKETLEWDQGPTIRRRVEPLSPNGARCRFRSWGSLTRSSRLWWT